MLSLLAEGLESIRLPCTFALLLPGVGAVLGGRQRAAWVVAGLLMGTGVVAWMRFAGWWFGDLSWWHFILMAAVVAGSAVAVHRSDHGAVAAGAGLLIGGVSSWLWLPCVGSALAEVINGSIRSPWSHLAGTFAYAVGVLVPLIFVAALPHLSERIEHLRDKDATAIVGLSLSLVVALAIAVGWYDDLAVELSRRSSF